MASRNCDSKTVIVLFIAIFMPDLPWRNPNFSIISSCAEASDLTDSKLNKHNEASSAPNVILPNLQIEPISHMLEKWESISSLCEEIIAELANASASLVACFIQNARPLTVCQNCVEEYINFYGVYKNVCIPTKNEDAQKCEDQLLNKDRLNVVQRSCGFASSLWSDGYCTNCFNTEDGLVTTHLNNETKRFLRRYDSVRSCFQVNATVGNVSVCILCLNVYSALIKEYDYLRQKYSDEVCMDLTDIMNSTRTLWTKHYDCKVIAADGLYIYLLTTLFCILVVLFYSGFRFIAHAQNTRIIEQKRFVSTHSYNSSSGQDQLHSLH